MISLRMDMIQYDCPYIHTTVENDVSFYTRQWEFDNEREELETRIVVDGDDRGAVNNGLGTLRDHPNMRGYDIIRRNGDVALIRSRIDQTDAMSVIRDHGGYISGPFEITDGSEIWNIGFDRESAVEGTLGALEHNNDFTVESRESMALEDYYELMRNVGPATSLLDGCHELSATERETLQTAVENGYFEIPRDVTLSTLADVFGVSKTAVSKNLRRGERKLLGRVMDAIEEIEIDEE